MTRTESGSPPTRAFDVVAAEQARGVGQVDEAPSGGPDSGRNRESEVAERDPERVLDSDGSRSRVRPGRPRRTADASPALSRRRSVLALAIALLALLPAPGARAEFFELYVDPAESRLRLAYGEMVLPLAPGLTATLPIESQTGVAGTSAWALPGGFPGDGFETALFGVVLAEIDATPSQLSLTPTGTLFAAGNSGIWAPTPVGGPGVGPANAAFRVEDPLLGIDLLGALRGVRGSLQAALVLTPDGVDAWTATGSLGLILSGGRIAFHTALPGLAGGSPLLTGPSPVASAVISGGRYEIVGPDLARLTLPFTTDPFMIYSDQLGPPLPASFMVTLNGTLVAYSKAVPEPGFAAGLVAGLGALAWLGGRRARRMRPLGRLDRPAGRLVLSRLTLLFSLLVCACQGADYYQEDYDEPLEQCSYSPSDAVVGVSYAGSQQCGSVSIDVDDDGNAEASDSGCQTPASDDPPGVLASATQPLTTGNAVAEVSILQTGDTSSVVCRYDLAESIAQGASCTASFQRTVTATPLPGGANLLDFYVAVRESTLGAGRDDPFNAAVVVSCPGQINPTLVGPAGYHVYINNVGSSPQTCIVAGQITSSSTTAEGSTLHELLVKISKCPDGNSCGFDFQCPSGSRCVADGTCSDGSAGASCLVRDHCSQTAPICFEGTRTCQAGALGDPCLVKGHCSGDLVCLAGECREEGSLSTIEIDLALLTPTLNLTGGERPRLTPDIDLAVVAQTSEPMGLVTATTIACNPADVSDCTPVSAGPSVPPGATSWSVDLAEYSSGVSGLAYQLDVSVEDTNGLPAQTSRTVDFEVYPKDLGVIATCTKSYSNGELSLSFTISPPPPATPGQVFDARLWLFRRSDAEGWPLDPIDPIWTGFTLTNPITLTPENDGEFQMVFTGLINFATPFQASLRLDTLGGPNDVCTLVP